MNDIKIEWLALVEIVHQLGQQRYTNRVGLTIFQQIAYVMTELGLKTGFLFQQGKHAGPFSTDAKTALAAMITADLIREKGVGQLTALEIGPAYAAQQGEMAQNIERFRKEIDMTVDLFSRIKNTAQGETVTTVLFAVRKLKKERGKHAVSEQDVLDFILSWKSRWDNPKKREGVISAIRHLQMLGWVRLELTPEIEFEPF